MKTIIFTLDDETHKKIKQVNVNGNRTVSGFMRHLILKELERQELDLRNQLANFVPARVL